MRTLTVGSSWDLEYEVNNLAIAGYKKKEEIPGISVRLMKKKGISAGFCFLWFLFGILPLIIYLIYCALREPQDDVLVMVEPREEDTSTTKPADSSSIEYETKVVEIRIKKRFMTGWGTTDSQIGRQLIPYSREWEVTNASDIQDVNRTTRLFYVTLRRPKTEDSEEEPPQDE